MKSIKKLDYKFIKKPLLIGGKAMEYYGLRKAGLDIDLVVCEKDHKLLVKKYPDNVKNLFGDIGICEFGFEIWNQICTFDYDYLKENAIEEKEYLVVSLEKLLFLKALAMKIPKYHKDLEMVVDLVLKKAYQDPKNIKITFRLLKIEDVDMVYDWLMEPHVKEWYGKNNDTKDQIYKKYTKRAKCEVPTESYIFQLNGVYVGYIQAYFYADYPETNNILQADDKTIGVDYFIGKPNFIHNGYGKYVVSKFLEEIVFTNPKCERCVILPNITNRASVKLCESNGFKCVENRIFTDEDGDSYVMVLDRKSFKPLY